MISKSTIFILRILLFAVAVILLGTIGFAAAANMVVPSTYAGRVSRVISLNNIKPQGCYSVDSLVTGGTGGSASELILGTAGDDTISGGAGNDCIVTGAGADIIDGGDGYDVCLSNGANDTFTNCEYPP